MNNYSDRIKQIIHINQLSIADFCRVIGLNSPTTVHLIIKNDRKPSSKTVERIIAAFPEVTEDWLLYGRGSYGETPKPKPLEDDLTVTASQVIKFIIKDLPSKIDQRDNQTASILLERLNDMDNKFQNITEQWDANFESHITKFEGYENEMESAAITLDSICKRLTELERYALLTLDEKNKLRAEIEKKKRNIN